MSLAGHRALCAQLTPRGKAPSKAPSKAPTARVASPSGWHRDGVWSRDADGQVRAPDGWVMHDPPAEIGDVSALPEYVPEEPEERPAKAKPGKKPGKRAAAKAKAAPVPLVPLPADTAQRIVRDVELRTLSPNRLQHEIFWQRADRRAKEHRTVREAFSGAELPSIARGLIVTLVRVGPVLLDTDRLAGSLYSVRDCIADLYSTDDSARAPVAWVYLQHRVLEKEPHRFPARPAKAAKPPFPAYPFRPARDGWRWRTWLRVTIETAVEYVAGGATAGCPSGPSLCRGRAGSPCPTPKPPGR